MRTSLCLPKLAWCQAAHTHCELAVARRDARADVALDRNIVGRIRKNEVDDVGTEKGGVDGRGEGLSADKAVPPSSQRSPTA